MSQPTAVVLVVGLNAKLLDEHAPILRRFARGGAISRLQPVLPAVTCSVQSSMLTGTLPREHGIVGNGWYHRELTEVQFWKQSNHLVRGEKVWEAARRVDPSATCANLFWWYNMYSSADLSVTPRPIYKADGRKVPDVYSWPPELGFELQRRFGTFPLFEFWGPNSSIRSSEWIANAAIHVHANYRPTLTLVYLPHLDYALQKLGPDDAGIGSAVGEVDRVFGQLLDHFEREGVRVVVVSEYGIEAVEDSVHVNRFLRESGDLRVRVEQGLELLDPGNSEAFAVVDHQVAHVYVRQRERIGEIGRLCEALPGVEQTLDRAAQSAAGVDHERSGDLVLVAGRGRWFSYDYWLDDARAPDFARTVDIHRKPGYDPLELFVDPELHFPALALARRLVLQKLGFRTLFDVIPLDTRLVRGSHGRTDLPDALMPLLIVGTPRGELPSVLPCTTVRDVILDQLFG